MINKNDFIELDFTSRVQGSEEVFDTTYPSEAKKSGLTSRRREEEFKPLRICVGQGMVINALDLALEGKDIGKDYESAFEPKEAFGTRDSKLVKIMPLSVFHQRGIEPSAGMTLALDNLLVKISAVSSGRVIVDFNNPLAGKIVVYKFRINRKFESAEEKLKILAEFFFGEAEKISSEGNKAVLTLNLLLPEEVNKEFLKKVKDIIGIELEIKYSKESNSDKKEENKEEPKS